MLYDEMLSWLLFYTSLLDVEKTPAQDVLDPGGLVKSQVVQSDDGRLRIVLNGSQSGRTQTSRFLSEAFGSGVQHIALSHRRPSGNGAPARGERREAAADARELLRRPRSQDRAHAWS